MPCCTIAIIAAFGQGPWRPRSPTDIFAPVSTPAQSIVELSVLVLAIAGAIFAIVSGLLAYATVNFRRRKDDDGREPAQVYGSTQVELAWTREGPASASSAPMAAWKWRSSADACFIPQGFGHWVEQIGGEMTQIIILFNNPLYAEIAMIAGCVLFRS
jgi:Cytochrome C oxidase subunit II, transmembrane domain